MFTLLPHGGATIVDVPSFNRERTSLFGQCELLVFLKVDFLIRKIQVLNYGSFALCKVSGTAPPSLPLLPPPQITTLFIVIKANAQVDQSKAPNSP